MRAILKASLAAMAITAATVIPAATASAAPTPLVGPECQPTVVTSVLTRLGELGVVLTPGQQVQYLEVFQTPSGAYSIRPCMVTMPA